LVVQFTVNLVDLKRSLRRLVMRLDDESFNGCDFAVFDVRRKEAADQEQQLIRRTVG